MQHDVYEEVHLDGAENVYLAVYRVGDSAAGLNPYRPGQYLPGDTRRLIVHPPDFRLPRVTTTDNRRHKPADPV